MSETGTGAGELELQQLRGALEAAQREAREARERAEAFEALERDREREELAEVDCLKAELADRDGERQELAALRDERGRFTSAFEGLYQAELEAVPEEKREALARLSAAGSWPERLEQLRTARGLIGAAPAAAGTVTQPGMGLPEVPPARAFDWRNPPTWAEVLKPAN